MFDKYKKHTLDELLNLYDMYNLEFKFYGNNNKGDLELYLKTDIDKISVFKSISKQSKYDYLKLNDIEAGKIKFVFDREVNEMDLDIVAIVLRTSDKNIPSGKYSLETLDKLTKEQDKELRIDDNLKDGISYIIVDNNTSCTLYDNVYLFNSGNNGLIDSLRKDINSEQETLRYNNLKMILDYYDNSTNQKTL